MGGVSSTPAINPTVKISAEGNTACFLCYCSSASDHANDDDLTIEEKRRKRKFLISLHLRYMISYYVSRFLVAEEVAKLTPRKKSPGRPPKQYDELGQRQKDRRDKKVRTIAAVLDSL